MRRRRSGLRGVETTSPERQTPGKRTPKSDVLKTCISKNARSASALPGIQRRARPARCAATAATPWRRRHNKKSRRLPAGTDQSRDRQLRSERALDTEEAAPASVVDAADDAVAKSATAEGIEAQILIEQLDTDVEAANGVQNS